MLPEIWSVADINFLSFWAIFSPFTQILTLKIKFGKNFQKPVDIILLYMCNINEDYMMYGS